MSHASPHCFKINDSNIKSGEGNTKLPGKSEVGWYVCDGPPHWSETRQVGISSMGVSSEGLPIVTPIGLSCTTEGASNISNLAIALEKHFRAQDPLIIKGLEYRFYEKLNAQQVVIRKVEFTNLVLSALEIKMDTGVGHINFTFIAEVLTDTMTPKVDNKAGSPVVTGIDMRNHTIKA